MAETAEEILEKYPKGKYINKLIIFNCFATIKPWLDMELLSDYLSKYGIIKNSEDMELVTSPYYKPHDRMTSLLKLMERSGRSGFLAFYVGLNESAEESRGHADAVAEINRHVDQASTKFSPEPESEDGSNGYASQDKAEPSPLPSRALKNGNASVDDQIAYLEGRFCTLSRSLYEELVEQNIKPKGVIKYMVSLPYNLKRELADSIKNNLSGIRKTKEVDELHVLLDSQLWNFIDYYLLGHIINNLGSSTLRSQLAEYVTELSEFMRRATISNLIQFWPGRKDTPLQYTEVSVTVDLNPNECTLEQLNTMRKTLCECFLPPLSEFAMLYYKFREGSVLVILLLTENLIPTLIKGVCSSESYKFFEEQNILSLCIKGITVYPLSVTNPPPRNTKSERNTDTDLQLWELQDQFYGLMKRFAIKLAVDDVSISDILHFVHSILPTEKRSLLEYLLTEVPSIKKCGTVIQLFNELQQYTSFLDHSLVKELIDEFATGILKQELLAYENEIEQFCSQTCVTDIAFGMVPKCFRELQICSKLSPLHSTLHNVEELRKIFASRVQITDTATILATTEIDSDLVCLTIAVPEYSIPDLRTAIKHQSNLGFYSETKITTITLDSEELYFESSNGGQNNGIMTLPSPHVSPTPPTLPPGNVQQKMAMNVTAEFESRVFHMNGNGQYPSISMNSKGWIVQVYHRETVVHLRLRYRIGYLNQNVIMWSNTHREYNKGFYPRIAINNDGLVVAVFAAQLGRRMWYRVGKLTFRENHNPNTGPSQQIVNGASIQWEGRKVLLGEGSNPVVAIDNNKTVAVVYDVGYLYIKTKYRIGDIQEDIISWRSKRKDLVSSQSSKHASIAMNDKGQVAIGYSNGFDRTVHYTSGMISSVLDDELIISESRYTPAGANYQPVVSINNKGRIVAVFHSLLGNLRLKMAYGVVRNESTQLPFIEWAGECEEFAANGYHASVAVNDKQDFVTCHKSLLTVPLHRSIHNYVGHL